MTAGCYRFLRRLRERALLPVVTGEGLHEARPAERIGALLWGAFLSPLLLV